MAEFSASDAAFTGFRIVARRPWVIAVWAGLQFVFSLALNLFVAYSAGPAFERLAEFAMRPPSEDPTAILDAFAPVAPTYLAMSVAALVLNAVLCAAINRAVLRPDESRFAYLRLASDELRQLGLFAIFALIGFGAYIAMVVVASVLIVIIALLSGGGPELGIGLAVLVPAVTIVFVFLGVRLSLASPLTFESQRISIGSAWRMTHGRFRRMLMTYLIAFALSFVVIALTYVIERAAVAVAAGGVDALGSLQSYAGTLQGVLTPARLASLVVSAIGQALIWPVTLAPAAAVYRALNPGPASRVFE